MFKILLALFFCSVLTYADIGFVKKTKGEVFLVRDNFLEPLNKGDKIKKNDLISTKKGSRVILSFNDGSAVTIGQNSDFSILDYLYDEAEAEANKVDFFYSRGIFKTVSGKIGKLNRKNYKLKTRTASMGIRGTEIYTNTSSDKDEIACLDGAVTVTSLSTNISVNIDKGYITVVEPDKDPSDPKLFSCEELFGVDKADCTKLKADSDKDGVFDFLDECPDSPADFETDFKGCPTGFQLRFNFVKNQTDIDTNHIDIQKVISYLKQNDSFKVQINAYTDIKGNKNTNMKLSRQRAYNVYKAFIDAGIDKNRLSYNGFGAKDFVASNATEEGRKLNRRIYIKFMEE